MNKAPFVFRPMGWWLLFVLAFACPAWAGDVDKQKEKEDEKRAQAAEKAFVDPLLDRELAVADKRQFAVLKTLDGGSASWTAPAPTAYTVAAAPFDIDEATTSLADGQVQVAVDVAHAADRRLLALLKSCGAFPGGAVEAPPAITFLAGDGNLFRYDGLQRVFAANPDLDVLVLGKVARWSLSGVEVRLTAFHRKRLGRPLLEIVCRKGAAANPSLEAGAAAAADLAALSARLDEALVEGVQALHAALTGSEAGKFPARGGRLSAFAAPKGETPDRGDVLLKHYLKCRIEAQRQLGVLDEFTEDDGTPAPDNAFLMAPSLRITAMEVAGPGGLDLDGFRADLLTSQPQKGFLSGKEELDLLRLGRKKDAGGQANRYQWAIATKTIRNLPAGVHFVRLVYDSRVDFYDFKGQKLPGRYQDKTFLESDIQVLPVAGNVFGADRASREAGRTRYAVVKVRPGRKTVLLSQLERTTKNLYICYKYSPILCRDYADHAERHAGDVMRALVGAHLRGDREELRALVEENLLVVIKQAPMLLLALQRVSDRADENIRLYLEGNQEKIVNYDFCNYVVDDGLFFGYSREKKLFQESCGAPGEPEGTLEWVRREMERSPGSPAVVTEQAARDLYKVFSLDVERNFSNQAKYVQAMERLFRLFVGSSAFRRELAARTSLMDKKGLKSLAKIDISGKKRSPEQVERDIMMKQLARYCQFSALRAQVYDRASELVLALSESVNAVLRQKAPGSGPDFYLDEVMVLYKRMGFPRTDRFLADDIPSASAAPTADRSAAPPPAQEQADEKKPGGVFGAFGSVAGKASPKSQDTEPEDSGYLFGTLDARSATQNDLELKDLVARAVPDPPDWKGFLDGLRDLDRPFQEITLIGQAMDEVFRCRRRKETSAAEAAERLAEFERELEALRAKVKAANLAVEQVRVENLLAAIRIDRFTESGKYTGTALETGMAARHPRPEPAREPVPAVRQAEAAATPAPAPGKPAEPAVAASRAADKAGSQSSTTSSGAADETARKKRAIPSTYLVQSWSSEPGTGSEEGPAGEAGSAGAGTGQGSQPESDLVAVRDQTKAKRNSRGKAVYTVVFRKDGEGAQMMNVEDDTAAEMIARTSSPAEVSRGARGTARKSSSGQAGRTARKGGRKGAGQGQGTLTAQSAARPTPAAPPAARPSPVLDAGALADLAAAPPELKADMQRFFGLRDSGLGMPSDLGYLALSFSQHFRSQAQWEECEKWARRSIDCNRRGNNLRAVALGGLLLAESLRARPVPPGEDAAPAGDRCARFLDDVLDEYERRSGWETKPAGGSADGLLQAVRFLQDRYGDVSRSLYGSLFELRLDPSLGEPDAEGALRVLERNKGVNMLNLFLQSRERPPQKKKGKSPAAGQGLELAGLRERLRELDLEKIRAGMPANAAIVSYGLGLEVEKANRSVNAFVVTRDGVRFFRLGDNAAWRQTDGLLRDIARLQSGGAPGAAELEALSRVLVQPLETELLGRERILVIPHEGLDRLPFGALTLTDGTVLLEKTAVSVLPNLATLQLLTERGAPPAGAAAGKKAATVAFGVGDFSRCADKTQWSPLPNTVPEAQDSARIYGGTALVGEKASYQAAMDWLGKASRLLFCTHACTDQDDILESRIILSDRPLSVRNLLESGSPLQADLVAFSACQTGVGVDVAASAGERAPGTDGGYAATGSSGGEAARPGGAERGVGVSKTASAAAAAAGPDEEDAPESGAEVFGIHIAFLYQGTRAVLGTLWNVDDTASRQVMTLFHRNLQSGLPPSAALRSAQLGYLRGEAAGAGGAERGVGVRKAGSSSTTVAGAGDSAGYLARAGLWAPFVAFTGWD